ncbi:MAG: hypothetical protein ABIO94_10275 [Opitutaceae bacterium]
MSLGAFSTVAAAPALPRVTPESFYTNDIFLPGVGYYHAPFRAFYPQPYNFYDPARKMYFYGGQWGPVPHESIVNISSPTVEAARAAEASRTDIRRGGFGNSSRTHSIRS